MKLLRSLLPEILGTLFGIVVLSFAYLVFSIAIQASSSSKLLDLSQGFNATSISVSVAIVLFIIKEALEYNRKRKARLRKTNALKAILSEEIELNHWTWKKVNDLTKIVKKEPSSTVFKIISSTSGTERFEYHRKDGSGGGQGFPLVYEDLINKIIIEIAELDEGFYVAAIDYMKAIAELNHLRASAYDFIFETKQGAHYTAGFIEYASDELPPIFAAMDRFYQVCNRTKLEKHRLR